MKNLSLYNFIRRYHKPKLSVPASNPLSPCIIPTHVENDGVIEENKGYVPVSLLINAIKNDRIQNISVAGNYGVGKSSVINTAEKELNKWSLFGKRHFLSESLLHIF